MLVWYTFTIFYRTFYYTYWNYSYIYWNFSNFFKLKDKAGKLKDKDICQEDEKLEPFVTMEKVVKACFGVQRDESTDIDQLNKELEEAVWSTGISITLKIHVILAHI